jgi:hypothetical protein
MDSGFWSAKLIGRLRAHRVRYSITVRQTKTIRAAIDTIGEAAWADIPYSADGVAQVAETPYRDDRLIVRRVRNLHDQQQLFPTWRYHAFVTDRPGTRPCWMPTTVATPSASWRSVTSSPVLGSRTCRPGV